MNYNAAAPVEKVIDLQICCSRIGRDLLDVEARQPADWKERLALTLGQTDGVIEHLRALQTKSAYSNNCKMARFLSLGASGANIAVTLSEINLAY